MTNFDFLLSDPQFTTFGEVAISAEKIYAIDPAACVLNCRRAVEFAVKWMYSVDSALVMPYDDRLASLMDTEDFRAIVDRDLWQRLKYIRQTGNAAAHTGKKITKEQARLCLENLWYFMDFVACCYGTTYSPGEFDPALLEQQTAAPAPAPVPEVDLAALMAENEALTGRAHRPPGGPAAQLHPQAPGPVRVQDPQAVHRRHAHRRGLDGGEGLAQRGGAARYAQQERGGLCRLCALR